MSEFSVTFAVQLLYVPPLAELSGEDVFELMCQATHVAGRYWIFEGEAEFLHVPGLVVAHGVTSGTGDLKEKELIEHCQEIFAYDLSDAPQQHVMLRELGRL